MRNKIITLIATAFVGAAGLSSCDLSVTNPTDISSDTYWKSESDIWSSLNDLYSYIVPGCNIYSDAFSDDVRCPYPWESAGSTFQTNGLGVQQDMGYNFIPIRRANDILEHLDQVEMDDNLRERVRAEVRLLRAWHYANLTLNFGKVPLLTERLEYSERDIERDEVAKVRQFVLDEMTAAAKALPTSYPGGYFQETSRITSYAAHAVLARTALNFGDHALAEQAAREVMKGPFKLHTIAAIPDAVAPEREQIEGLVDFDALGLNAEDFIRGVFSYRSVWDPENVQPGSPECILVREYLPGNADYTDLTRYTSMRPDQMVLGWSSVVPQQPLVDAYWTADGKPYEPSVTPAQREANWRTVETLFKTASKNEKSFRTFANEMVTSGEYLEYPFFDEFRNRDPRLYASILFHFHRVADTDAGSDFIYQWINGANNESTTGYNFIKMVAKSTGTMLWEAYPTSEANFPSIRYAEVLLIFAEAHTYNTGYDSEVRKALNQIRERVGMPHVPESLSQAEAIDLIRAERRIELAGEGFRLDDLRRYGSDYARAHMGDVAVVAPNGSTVLTMKWDDRMMLFPIPQTAIDVNPLLKDDQNPGY